MVFLVFMMVENQHKKHFYFILKFIYYFKIILLNYLKESPYKKLSQSLFQITAPKIKIIEEMYYSKDQRYFNALNNKIIREQIDKKIKEQIFGKREAYDNNKRRQSSITQFEYLKTECEQLSKASFKTQISCHGNAFYNSVILVGQSKYNS
ncbi:hypothetical protein ABPG72_008085 [Tetrahymena utriculariae]